MLGLHFAPIIVTILGASYNSRSKQPYLSALKQGGAEGSSGKSKKKLFKNASKQISSLSWDQLVISTELKSELQAVVKLLSDTKSAERYGISVPKGILLSGPPGTGKTTIAKVMANEAKLKFFPLNKDEIVSKYVGESEKNLTEFFNIARSSAPAVVFIDEVDALGRGRSSSASEHGQNLLNHLLQQIDGIYDSKGIYVIAATNRADMVDDALKRSGRLTKEIVIGLPDRDSRERLFNLFLSKLPLEQTLDITTLANLTEGISGADIKAICDQAGVNAFQRESNNKSRNYKVNITDLQKAFEDILKSKLKPSN
jgi:ATP-dependent 26S proteasome regulatory subunit